MSAAYGPIRCDRCGNPIRGKVKTVPVFSDSGARPDVKMHDNPLACAPRGRR